MQKKIIKTAAIVTAAVMAVPVQALAAIPATVQVGQVVSISAADMVTYSGYASYDSVERAYSEAVSNITSNNTKIDSSDGKLSVDGGNSIWNDVNTDDLVKNLPQKESKIMDYDEFMKYLEGQNDEIKKKYEAAKKHAQEEQRKGSKAGAQAIKDAIEKSKNGANPVTGEKNGSSKDSDGSSFYDMLRAMGDEIWNRLKNQKGQENTEPEDPVLDDGDYEEYTQFIKDKYADYLKDGLYNLIKYREMDEDEYINDKIVYEKENNDYRDIKYKCATCGKVYGFETFCDCGKYLEGMMHHASKNVDDFDHFDDDGFSWQGSSLFGGGDVGSVTCRWCGKPMTLKSLDFGQDKEEVYDCYYIGNDVMHLDEETLKNDPSLKNNLARYKVDSFYYSTDGRWTCKSCYDAFGFSDSEAKTTEDRMSGSVFNPKFERAIRPVKATIYETDKKDLSQDGILKSYLDSLSEEDRETAEEWLDKYEQIKDDWMGGSDAGSGPTAEDYAMLDEFYRIYRDALKNKDTDNSLPDQNKGSNGWTQKELDAFEAAKDAVYNDGVPDEDYWDGEDGKKIADTKDYDDNVNKVFAKWPADQTKWTSEQKRQYEEFEQKFHKDKKMQDTMQELVDQGVISKDKSTDEILKGIDDYIAGFTSISDTVTVTITGDKVAEETHTNSKKYKVQGNTTVSVYAPDGSAVATEMPIAKDYPYRWVPDTAGTYTVKRETQLYDVTWDIVTATYHLKAEAQLPDGSTVLISEKEITRMVEDKSGMKSSNVEYRQAPDLTVIVTPRTLDIDKQDFYDTERIS